MYYSDFQNAAKYIYQGIVFYFSSFLSKRTNNLSIENDITGCKLQCVIISY